MRIHFHFSYFLPSLNQMENQRKLYIMLLFAIFLCTGVSVRGENMSSVSYSVNDGLSNNTVKAICQDERGYIWIGTKNGLNRLDGYDIKNYYHLPSQTSRQPNDIVSISRLSDGLFWIGTFSGIVLFDPDEEKFVDVGEKYQHKHLPASVVTGIHETPDGDVYVATKQGLYRFCRDNGTCEELEEFRDTYIHSMTSADDNKVLIDVYGEGLDLLDLSSGRRTPLLTNKNGFSIMAGLKDKAGTVWLGRELNELYKYSPNDGTLSPIAATSEPKVMLRNNYIHDICQRDDSTLLLATDLGLVCFDMVKSRLYVHPELDNHKRLMTVYQDRQHNIWTGSFGQGATYYHPLQNVFRHYPLDNGGNDCIHVVGKMAELNDKLWIGHSKGLIGINPENPTEIERVSLGGIDAEGEPELYYAEPVDDSKIYLYFLNRGLYVFTPADGRLIHEEINLGGEEQVRAITTDVEGALWIAADDLGYINRATGKFDRNFSTNYSGTTRYMLTQDILRNGDSMIIGARTNGIWIYPYHPEKYEHYFKGVQPDVSRLKNINVSVLYKDSKNNIWVGTYDGGLYRWNQSQRGLKHFSTDNGLVHNSICAIVEDKTNGDIWVAAINGLSRIKNDGVIANYNHKNGFPLDEVSTKSMIQTGNGNIFIGGNNGIAEIDSSNLAMRAREVPTVAISVLETLGGQGSAEYISFGYPCNEDGIKLPYDNSTIRIKFSTLDFSAPETYRYSYRLIGLDDEWHEIEQNEVIYSNLSSGKYKFEVIALDAEGHFSENVCSLSFKVKPAPWATWWAILLYLLFILSFAYIVVRYFRQKKESDYRQKIERIEKDNIRKNYQMRIELFTNFSHELRTPLTLITGPVDDLMQDPRLPGELKMTVRQIQKNSNRLHLLVNQLLDFRKLEHGVVRLKLSRIRLSEFVAEQIDSFRELLTRHDLSVEYKNSYDGDEVWADADLLSKVMFNLLSNAIKHSPKGSVIYIATSLSDDSKSVNITVRDCGEGIDPKYQKSIFDPFFQIGTANKKQMFGSGIGLSLVRYVMELHKGNIRVESELGNGASFIVELPLGTAHFSPEEVSYVEDTHAAAFRQETPHADENLLTEGMEMHDSEDSRPRILVVEDDDDLRQYIVGKLSGEYNVMSASNGRDGLETARKELPDLIVSDIVMPLMDGIELCTNVKQDSAMGHIPVILLTARSLDEQIAEGYGALADDYVLKPFKGNILMAKINSLLQNRAKLRLLLSNKIETPDVAIEEIKNEDPFMNELIELIKKYANDSSLTIETLYTELGMSRTQFFRKIKAVSDLSPNKLILDIRMKMAVEKFKDGDKTISEVAYDVGFSDPAYFSKVFKSVFNMTPTEYQSQQRKSRRK